MKMHLYALEGSGTVLKAHALEVCDPARGPCPIHRRTDHHMRKYPQVWRDDRGIMERMCPHGCGHPDPDDPKCFGPGAEKHEAIHGCDGCCQEPNTVNPTYNK